MRPRATASAPAGTSSTTTAPAATKAPSPTSTGATNTELRQSRGAGLRASMGEEKYARRVKSVLKMYPTGRIGEPADAASAILYLSSTQAGWVTGQVLSVNGGFTMA